MVSGMFLLLVFAVQFLTFSVTYKIKTSLFQVPTCQTKTYCEDIPHYPIDIMVDALKKSPHLHDYIYKDEIDVITHTGNEPDEESLCLSAEQVIFPKSGLTKSSEWKYIVNHENFTQSVRIETCLEQDKPCKVIEGFAEGYYTKCRQKYIYRQLLSLGPNGLIDRDSFRFPASCCCHIEFQAEKFLRSFNSRN